MNSFFAIGMELLAVLIMGIINGVILEKGEVATFINNDVF